MWFQVGWSEVVNQAHNLSATKTNNSYIELSQKKIVLQMENREKTQIIKK